MHHTKLIHNLIEELSYRVGVPNIYNKEHQSIMSEILTEWGEIESKHIIFEFLTEAEPKKSAEDEKYKNTGGSGYVKAQDYDKWKANPKGDFEKFTKTPSGKYEPRKDDSEGGDKKEKEQGTALKDPSYKKIVKKEKEIQKKLEDEESGQSNSDVKSEKLKKVLQDVGTSTNPEIRIVSKEVLQEFNDDTDKSDKEKKEIREMLDSVETLEGDFKERALVLTAIGQLYGTRENSGFMKNNLGLADRDQMVKNQQNLMELYDDADPKLVEEGVRKVRKNKVSGKFVSESFDTLPPKLKKYLSAAGNGGKDVGENHFLGYRKEDGSVTSDINEAGENAEIVRGKVPSKDRAKLAWRMYLEQGGVCGYSGLPLDLEEMDLEHVVGMQNDDKGNPTDTDVLNRENEKNQILVSSRFNQKKSDLNMDEFYKREIEPLKSKSKEDFEKLERGKESVKKIKPQTEQTALRLMDEVSFRIAGGGTITQSEYENLDDDKKPELTLSEDGVPKVKSAIIGPNVTQDSLIKEFEMEDARYSEIKETMLGEVTDKDDISKIKKLNTKIGKRVIQAMGLPGNLPNENRRTNSISSNDDFYRGYSESIAALPIEKRQEARKAWKEAIAEGSKRDKDGNLLNGKKYGKVQKDEFCKYLRDREFISDEMVAKYPIWRYRNTDGNKV
jgi:hypothetical protein